MFQYLREIVIPNLLFVITLILAVVLVMLVVMGPWLVADADSRLLHLFAHDSTVRRTALASSLGLAVTAFVFFRPGLLRKKSNKPAPAAAVDFRGGLENSGES